MNELDQKMVFISPLGSQKRMMSSAWIQRRAGNATAPHCRETGFISPVISPRPGFRSLLPTDLFIYLFLNFLIFWHLWEEVLLSTQPCAGQPQSLVVLGLLEPESDSQDGIVRPVPIPDGRLELEANSYAVGRGVCVVDGSIHYIGCWHFWGWGGSVVWCRPCQSASYCGGRVELWFSLSKRCLGPFLSTLLVSTCRVCATGTQEDTYRNVNRAVLQLFLAVLNVSNQATLACLKS